MTRSEYMLALNLEGLYKAFMNSKDITPDQEKALGIARSVLDKVNDGYLDEIREAANDHRHHN